jgi:hypothetical protein
VLHAPAPNMYLCSTGKTDQHLLRQHQQFNKCTQERAKGSLLRFCVCMIACSKGS